MVVSAYDGNMTGNILMILYTLSEIVPKGCHSVAQNAASTVENWSALNKLQLNPDNCKELRIDFKKQKHN